MSLIKVKSRGTDNVSGRKNIFINGDMVIAQRGTSATTTGGYHNIDRWNYQHSTDGGFSGTQSSDVPSGTGFRKSLLWTVTSADSSFSSGQYAYIRQVVEGQNCAHLKLGTSDAKTITLSFYVKSSVTGTFSGAMCNDDFNRSYPYTYTINSANTWEKKSVTIPCDTSGTWKIDNDRGFFMTWALGSGSQYLGTAGQWNASGQIAAAGTTNLMATNGATWYLTGCQVEIGDTATDFEHRSFGEELSLCHRYFFNVLDGATGQFPVNHGNAISTGNNGHIAFTIPLPQPMRADPTFVHDLANSNYQAVSPGATQWSFYYQNQGWGGKAGNGDLNTLGRTMNGKSSITMGTYYITPANSSSDQLRVGASLKMWCNAEL